MSVALRHVVRPALPLLVLLAAAPAPVRAQAAPSNPLVQLFGVAPDSARAVLEEIARGMRADCRVSGAVQTGTPPR
jgi:hypothetical protein